MTEKEKQAKLQYLLNSLSMTKEQKDIVIELVNSSGNGGGSGVNIKTIHVNYHPDGAYTRYSLSIDDVTTENKRNDDNGYIRLLSPEFVDKINYYVNKDCLFNITDGSQVKMTSVPVFIDTFENVTTVIITLTFIPGEQLIFVITNNQE